MEANKILKDFKDENPQLVALNPEIHVDEIIDSSTHNWVKSDIPVYQISIRHPFVFDVRLIPSVFKGIPVKNVWVGQFPPEFPSSNEEGIPLGIWYAPERYETFVDGNLSMLSKELQIPNLTRMEALDALTEGFQKHKDWCSVGT